MSEEIKELWKLRPHQQKGLDLTKQSFREGKTRPVFQAACGYGKSVIMSHIIDSALDKGNRVLVIVPYGPLINQLMKNFTDQGIPLGGVMQSKHKWTNPKKRLQVATIQTLTRRGFPETDLIIFDECHILYQVFIDYMKNHNTPVIGFSATPWTKGMGKYYDNLIQPISMTELTDKFYLSEYIAYAPCVPDMTGVKVSMGDYNETQTGERMSEPKIVGSITDTWIKLGENEPTIAFCTNVAHANAVGSAFDSLGVSNVVITAKTETEDREELFKKFRKREITILINVGTLVAGFDADVRCIIYARPTKSIMRWVQCVGRGLRTANGKERMILLDHSGTIQSLGRPEDIIINSLDDGENTKAIAAKVEKEIKEKLPKECPKCKLVKDAGVHTCPACGFEPRITKDVEVQEGELVQIKGKTKKVDKQQFWSELLGWRSDMRFSGKTYSDGYLSHTYKAKFGVWPRGLSNNMDEASESTLGFIKSKQIAFAKGKK